MFKRVEKRRKRKQEEEELGLDEDMKEVLGIHDTDSEESASDSEDSSEDEENSGEELDGAEEDAEIFEADDNEGSNDEQDDGQEEEEDPDVSVSQALLDPIYVVSVLPEVKACILCPGKLLKSVTMVQLHRISNAHERRLKQFKTLSVNSDPKESAWEVLKKHAEEKPNLTLAPSTNLSSKRAEKKKAQQARRKAKREKFKARQVKKALAAAASSPAKTTEAESKRKSTLPKSKKAEKIDTSNSVDVTTPPKKKRKVESSDNQATAETQKSKTAGNGVAEIPNPRKPKHQISSPALSSSPVATEEPKKNQELVKTIVRSTSDRAKMARSRALSMSKGGGKGRP